VIATAEPVIGAVAAWSLFSQTMVQLQILGMVLIVLSVASVQQRGVAEVEVPLDARTKESPLDPQPPDSRVTGNRREG
jgi:drug/metabolite transporter (DMT)-like permease